VEEAQTIQRRKEKGQTPISKTMHKILRIEKHESH